MPGFRAIGAGYGTTASAARSVSAGSSGTPDLPAHCLGHIGYAVPAWKRRHGYATKALGLLLPEVAKEGLPYVELTTDPDNLPSQRVITANGGHLVKRFTKIAAYGDNVEALLFRIALPAT